MDNYPANYRIKKYRKRELTPRQIAYCEAILADYSSAEAYRIAGYKSDKNVNLLQCSRIKEYLNSRQGRFAYVPVTYESKLAKLGQIIETTIPTIVSDQTKKNIDFKVGISAIAEANKMQGHYAPTNVQQVNVEATIEDIRNARLEYKKDK